MATGTSVGSLFWSTGVDFSGFKRDAKKGQSAMSGLFNPAVIGSAALGAAMIKLGSDALKFSKEFETAFAEVQTISESARENADEMSAAILKMTTEIPVGAVDSTKALYQIVSAGFDGAEAMSVLEISAKAAVAGVTTTAIAADTLTTIINAYGLDAQEATNISDALFKTVELGKTTLSEIGSSFSNVASLAAAYGVNVNEALAATAAMTKQGAPTAQAMTAIRAAIISITEKMGENVFQTHSFGEALQLARNEADKSGKGLKDYFGRVEAINGVLMLTNENANVYADSLDKINDSAGSADKALVIMNGTLESQEKLLANNFKLLQKEMGDQLSELKKGFLPWLNRELKILTDSTIPGYAKALSVLGNVITLGFGNFTAEGFSPDLVKSLLRSERAVEDFTKKSKSLSNEAFQNEINNIKDQQAANIKAFEDLEDRKKKGQKFDADALEEAKDRNLIFYQILESAELRLAGIRDKKKKKGDPIVLEEISLGSLKKDIKDSRDKLEKASFGKAVTIEVKLRAKEAELEKFISSINDRIRSNEFKASGSTGITPLESKGFANDEQKKQHEDRVKKLKNANIQLVKMNDNWVKIAKAKQKADNDADSAQLAKNAEQLANHLFDVADVADGLADAIAPFNAELANSISQVAELAGAAGRIASGDVVGGSIQFLTSRIQTMGEAYDVIFGSMSSVEELQQRINDTISAQNKKLEYQLGLIKESSGAARARLGGETISDIEAGIEDLNKQADELDLTFTKKSKSKWWKKIAVALTGPAGLIGSFFMNTDKGSKINIESLDALAEAYAGVGDKGKAMTEAIAKGWKLTNEEDIKKILAQYQELKDRRKELIEEFAQTNAVEMSDQITQALIEGGTKGADAVEDALKGALKNALVEGFRQEFLMAKLKEFTTQLGVFGATEEGVKGHITELKALYKDLMGGVNEEWDSFRNSIKDIAGEDLFADTSAGDSASGASGAIGRAITEDTATEWIGIQNRVLFETISHTAILTESNGYLSEIAVNTSRTAIACESLDSKINSDSSDRDSGNLI